MTADFVAGAPAVPAGATLPDEGDALLTADLFTLGRRASAARRAALGDRASFARARQLAPGGAWRGPRDAAESWVDEDDLPALGGWDAARAAGVDLLVGGRDPALHRAAAAAGARSLWRLPFRSGEPPAERRHRFEALAALITAGLV